MTLRPLGGWTAAHAHCGNLFVDGSMRVRYADWEGALLHDGAAPLAHFIRALRGTLDPAVAALAHALYEMGCGFEADAPRPRSTRRAARGRSSAASRRSSTRRRAPSCR